MILAARQTASTTRERPTTWIKTKACAPHQPLSEAESREVRLFQSSRMIKRRSRRSMRFKEMKMMRMQVFRLKSKVRQHLLTTLAAQQWSLTQLLAIKAKNPALLNLFMHLAFLLWCHGKLLLYKLNFLAAMTKYIFVKACLPSTLQFIFLNLECYNISFWKKFGEESKALFRLFNRSS